SFADANRGHHGYIYQATNWIYTGLSEKGGKNFDYWFGDRNYHGREVDEPFIRKMFGSYDTSKTIVENWESFGGEARAFGLKHRYIKFLGDKRQKNEMDRNFRYKSLPYPKGDNIRYDIGKKVSSQNILF